MKGYVYILSNPAMPGLLKIGRSIHGGQKRADQIFKTGVPAEFVLEFELFSDSCDWLEAEVHKALRHCRCSNYREFFETTVTEASEAIVKLYLEEISGSDSKVVDSLNCTAHVDLLYISHKYDLAPADVFESVAYLSEFSVRSAVSEYHQALARRFVELGVG